MGAYRMNSFHPFWLPVPGWLFGEQNPRVDRGRSPTNRDRMGKFFTFFTKKSDDGDPSHTHGSVDKMACISNSYLFEHPAIVHWSMTVGEPGHKTHHENSFLSSLFSPPPKKKASRVPPCWSPRFHRGGKELNRVRCSWGLYFCWQGSKLLTWSSEPGQSLENGIFGFFCSSILDMLEMKLCFEHVARSIFRHLCLFPVEAHGTGVLLRRMNCNTFPETNSLHLQKIWHTNRKFIFQTLIFRGSVRFLVKSHPISAKHIQISLIRGRWNSRIFIASLVWGRMVIYKPGFFQKKTLLLSIKSWLLSRIRKQWFIMNVHKTGAVFLPYKH